MSSYQSKRTSRAMNFYCDEPQAGSVSLVGDFNHWDEKSTRLEIKQVIEPKECDINVKQILEEESLTPKEQLDNTALQSIFPDLR